MHPYNSIGILIFESCHTHEIVRVESFAMTIASGQRNRWGGWGLLFHDESVC